MADKDHLIYKIVNNRDKILEIAKKYGVENIRIFGSVSRKQEKRDSDIDLLVDVVTKPDGTMGNYIDFALALKKLYKRRRIQVCTPETLHPRFRKKVLANCFSITEDNPYDISNTQIDERDYVVNVEKTQKAIVEFWKIVKLGKKKFLNNKATRHDAVREMQIAVEEITRSISKEIKKQIKDVDWEGIKEFRNFIVHNYDNVVWEAMWEVAQEKIKETEKACKRILEVLGEDKK